MTKNKCNNLSNLYSSNNMHSMEEFWVDKIEFTPKGGITIQEWVANNINEEDLKGLRHITTLSTKR